MADKDDKPREVWSLIDAGAQGLSRVKRVRIVGIPRPQDVDMYGAAPSVLRPFADRYHTSPCSLCDSRCCMEDVCINIVDLARLVLLLGVVPQDVVELAAEHNSTLTLPPRIEGRPQHMLLRKVETPGLPRPACHMLARPGGQLRCGVHGVRPGVCRAYPFRFVTDLEHEFAVGLPFLCPIGWALETRARKQQEQEILAWRDQNDFAERKIKRWNRDHGDEDATAFFRWAVVEGAKKLKLDARPFIQAHKPRGFTKQRLW